MRKVACIFAFLALTLNSIAQKVQKRFEYANYLYKNEEYDSALYLFTKIYNKGVGSPDLIAKSYYNIGVIYLDKKDTINTKRIFTNILSSDFDDMDRGGTGEGLMAEPYAIYKNNSCRILAGIALHEKDFKNALRYTQMADKDYPYRHFCGNEYAANDIYMASMYAKCYAGLDDINRAIQILMPHCIENGLASNNRLIQQLCGLLKKKYSREEIQQEVNAAITGIYVKVTKHSDYIDSNYCAKIFNTELKLGNYSFYIDYRKSKDFNGIELYRNHFKESEFIKNLIQ